MTDQREITDAWRHNVRQSLAAIGAGEAFDKLDREAQDEVCRTWSWYVDRGADFGTAAYWTVKELSGGSD